jgi:hypothetical protein
VTAGPRVGWWQIDTRLPGVPHALVEILGSLRPPPNAETASRTKAIRNGYV